MAKEETLFEELDHLYEEAKKAKRSLDEYQANGGSVDKLKDNLRHILEDIIDFDIRELKVLHAAMEQFEKLDIHEKIAIGEIIKFTGLIYQIK